ncbi:MAG: hypothetical protein WCT37_02610 [Patescibacteria group bacterium]|jgi:hypothetical protein
MKKTFRLAIIAIRRTLSRRDNKGSSIPVTRPLVRGSYTAGVSMNNPNNTF